MFVRCRMGWVVLCLLALAMSACGPAPTGTALPTRTPLPFPTAAPGSQVPVTRGAITYTVASRGRVMSSREATLSFPTGGLLRALSVQGGAQVKKGDVIAELEAWDMETAVFEAQAAVDLLQAQLTRAKTLQAQQLAAARADLEVSKAQDAVSALARQRVLQQIQDGQIPHDSNVEQLVKDVEAQSALDRARLDQAQVRYQISLADTEVPLLTESLRIAKARLERQQSRLDTSKLRAPFDGVVVALDAKAGDSLQVYQKLGLLADPSQPILVASVFEDDLPRLSVGQPVTIKLDSSPSRALTGKISQIGVQPISSQGKNAYEVTITFDEARTASLTIRQGAEVSFPVQTAPDALLVSARAIFREGVQAYVQVLRDGVATRVPIQVGVSDGTRTVILAGLQEGDTVRVP